MPSYKPKDLEHARKRVAEMTTKQLLTRLGRMTIHAKLWAFERAVAEYMESRTTVDEVTEYYNVYLRVHNRLGIEPHQVERTLSSFISRLAEEAYDSKYLRKKADDGWPRDGDVVISSAAPKQGKAKAPRRRLTIE